MSSSAASTPAKLASTITNNLSSLASRTLATTSTQAALMQSVKKIIPPLTSTKHKGQAGRIGIVGGSRDYTGAPFFASMSSMRFGCDLSYTICTPEAGNVIKTYSPDLIVNRLLDPDVPWDTVRSNVDALFERFHAVVVGPGLGRDDFMQKCAKLCIQLARKHDMYIVIDADGLWLLQNEPELIQGYTKAVLTPNVAEFARLCTKLNIDHKQDPDNAALALAKALQGPTILEKGKVDRITNGNDQGEVYTVDAEGGLKRCGGQGDILAGCLGTFAGWVKIYEQEHSTTSSSSSSSSTTDNGAGGGGGAAAAAAAGGGGGGEVRPDRLLMLAAYGAALTARTCSRLAYRKKGRAMLADDLLPEVGTAYEQLWGDVQAASL